MAQDDENVYPLDDAAIEFIAEHEREVSRLQTRVAGMLDYYARHHALKGNWRIAENRRELVRNPEPGPPVLDGMKG